LIRPKDFLSVWKGKNTFPLPFLPPYREVVGRDGAQIFLEFLLELKGIHHFWFFARLEQCQQFGVVVGHQVEGDHGRGGDFDVAKREARAGLLGGVFDKNL
jgi:hypothetical protein